MQSRVDLLPVLTEQGDGFEGAGFGGEEDRLLVRAISLDDDRLSLFVQLENVRRGAHAGPDPLALIPIHNDFVSQIIHLRLTVLPLRPNILYPRRVICTMQASERRWGVMPRYIEQMVSQQVRRSELARRRDAENGHPPCETSVVTISRRMGSGARVVAQSLADKLGWSLWDKELLDAMAEHAQVSERVVQAFDEHTISEIELFTRGLFGEQEMAGFIYPRQLARAVKTISKLGNVIILGRGANFILPDALKVRIDASDEYRIRNMMEYEGLTRDEATAKLHASDRDRRHFLTTVFGKERVEHAVFDLTIWMDRFTNDDAVEIILAAVKAKCRRG